MQHAIHIETFPERRSRSEARRFIFGGVAFDVSAGPGVDWELSDEHHPYLGDYEQEPVFARVHLAVTASRELSFERDRAVVGRWDEDIASVRTARVRAEIRDLGSSFVATAAIAPDERGCANLCTAVLAMIAERRGAAILHAVGVELDAEAVLFIGPSGAGKSTAANHCERGRWFSRDRAIVFSVGERWFAMGLPGGGECDLERSRERVFPLAGIYRIRQAVGTARVEALGLGERVAVLRECLFAPEAGARSESARLSALVELASSARVAALHTVLGRPLRALLSSRGA